MLPLIAGLLWLIAANLIAMLPTRDHHWRAAYVLMALGLPLVPLIWQSHGAPGALAFLLAAASILRWPLWFAWKRLRQALPGARRANP